MTDTIRDLLISLSSHMAYMQGQLEAGLVLYDPEDYYWYRESVLLRQKVTDALANEPAVPDGREPASVTGQPSDEELYDYWISTSPEFGCADPVDFARAVLARWGNPAPQPPAEGEVEELVQHLHHAAEVDGWDGASPEWCQSMLRAAELLERQATACAICERERLHQSTRAADLEVERQAAPVPVSERLPGEVQP